MEIKILQVFYGKDGLPYKDKDRQVHFPIAGTGFLGASNTTKIKFYYDELDNLDETSWVAVSKLPNGKVGSRVLESYLDEELNEHYALLELDNYYTQYKGDVFISLQGYQGGVDFDYDEENSQYEIHGTPTIAATGSIKFTINYANQFVGSGETDNINFQRILAALGTKLGMRAYSEHVEELPSEGSPDVFYVVNDDPNDPNLANIYVWNENTRHYIWVGDNTLDLGNYYTKEQGEQFESGINNRVTSVENELSSVASGSPKGVYATLSDLESAYPIGADGIYVVQADGHWYFWNGNAWTDGGAYLNSNFLIDNFENMNVKGYFKTLTDLSTNYPSGNDYVYVVEENNNWYYWSSTANQWVSGGAYLDSVKLEQLKNISNDYGITNFENSTKEENFENHLTNTTKHTGYYMNSSGTQTQNALWDNYEFDVSLGDKFHIKTYYVPAAPAVVFVDANGMVILNEPVGGTGGIWEGDVLVPFGAVKAFVNLENDIFASPVITKRISITMSVRGDAYNPLKGKSFIALGDSITYGQCVVGDRSKVWGSLIASRNGMSFTNAGISGSTMGVPVAEKTYESWNSHGTTESGYMQANGNVGTSTAWNHIVFDINPFELYKVYTYYVPAAPAVCFFDEDDNPISSLPVDGQGGIVTIEFYAPANAKKMVVNYENDILTAQVQKVTNMTSPCYASDRYKQIKDKDYAIIWFGWNDYYYCDLGTISQADATKFLDAYYNTLVWLVENSPKTKIGVIIPYLWTYNVDPQGYSIMDLINGLKQVCDLCAIPYLDINKFNFLQSWGSDYPNDANYYVKWNCKQQVFTSDTLHPNEDGNAYLSTIIENFMKSL